MNASSNRTRMRAGVVSLLALLIMGALGGFASPAQAAAEVAIKSRLNVKCLDIEGISAANGANVQIWDCWNGANQRWYEEAA